MKRQKQRINARRAYVKREVSRLYKRGYRVDVAIQKLSDRLFLSERTIREDLRS